MHKVVIIGSGGHAKVIVDILRNSKNYSPVGFTDPNPQGKTIMGLPVLGDDSFLPELLKKGLRHAFVAIGDNRRRVELSDSVRSIGFELINAISPYAYISPTATLGVGIAIMPGAIIHPDTVIQDYVIINTGATVDHDCFIEIGCHIAGGCTIAGNVKVGLGSLLSVGCKVIPKVNIGEWTIVGAGAVVVNDLPGYSMAIGVPAKIVKKLQEEKV